jgi:hypothetical protein
MRPRTRGASGVRRGKYDRLGTAHASVLWWLFRPPRHRGSMNALKLASMVATVGAIVLSSACKGDHAGDNTVKGVDTMVTSTKVRDTTVVKSDTTIHTDTVKKTDHAADAKKP